MNWIDRLQYRIAGGIHAACVVSIITMGVMFIAIATGHGR